MAAADKAKEEAKKGNEKLAKLMVSKRDLMLELGLECKPFALTKKVNANKVDSEKADAKKVDSEKVDVKKVDIKIETSAQEPKEREERDGFIYKYGHLYVWALLG